jgi:hypothetical protein
MIERKERITEKAIIIGFLISLLILSISLKTNSNTANTLQMGNIGLPEKAIEELRKLLGH